MDTNSLPKYSFAFPEQPSYPAGPSHIHARKLAGSTPLSALPTFTFTDSKPASSTNGFNWTAAGAKPPTAVGGNWMCDTCMLTNPDDAKEKCTICEAPRPGATPAASKSPAAAPSSVNPPSAPIQAFDWGAAGIKPPKSASGSWTCSTCMLSNPATATEKCTICDTPR
ncbi:hypothetical protein BJ138DRAFT_1007405 [Hygrophoropsis aurantiaca]|uniref:Uncharacterized protein n=1 Tax=Hygrophoropsis aurantiaca TaxID=72124 RepID=A0ACB8AE77_9AGAM|nr:hypothetical protein BJ138DRAFT_1007405 [Hygrophoropsis aurantiaca]